VDANLLREKLTGTELPIGDAKSNGRFMMGDRVIYRRRVTSGTGYVAYREESCIVTRTEPDAIEILRVVDPVDGTIWRGPRLVLQDVPRRSAQSRGDYGGSRQYDDFDSITVVASAHDDGRVH